MSRSAVKNLRKTLQGMSVQVEKFVTSYREMSSSISAMATIYSTHFISVTRKVGNDPFEFDNVADQLKKTFKKHLLPLEEEILIPCRRMIPISSEIENRMDDVNVLAKSYRQKIEKYETLRSSESVKSKDLKATEEKLVKSQHEYESSRKDLVEDMEDFFQHTYNFIDESFYKMMETHSITVKALQEQSNRVLLIAQKRGPSFKEFSKEYNREDNSLDILEDLDSLLTSEIAVDYFQQFLRSEYSIENLLFLKAVLRLKEHKNPQDIHQLADEIQRRFINSSGENQVNITAIQKNYVNDQITAGNYSHGMFDRATKEVYSLMKTDTFPRFLKSPTCIQLKRRLKRRHINFTSLFDPHAIALIDDPQGVTLRRKSSKLSLGFFKRSNSSISRRSPRLSNSSSSSSSHLSPASINGAGLRSSMERPSSTSIPEKPASTSAPPPLSRDETVEMPASKRPSNESKSSIGTGTLRLKRWKKKKSMAKLTKAVDAESLSPR